MAPRSYNNENRVALQQELRGRIAAAAARLHAQKGALATSYADIAKEAGVSLPTVYNHFPEMGQLIAACTGHAASQAPEMPVPRILAAPTLEAAATLLVEAMDAINGYYEPWSAWNEQSRIPALHEVLEARRLQLVGLIEQVLAQHLGRGRHGQRAAAWETVVNFATWHRLLREHALPPAAVRRLQLTLLLAVAGPQPAATPDPRPTRK